MKILTAAFIVLTLCLLGGSFIAPEPALASAGSNVCEAKPKATKDKTEVGTFLQGICTECYDQGDCAIRDMEMVFVNVGNFTVEIVGALVLLMYVIGGACFLISHGDPAWVTKGKQFIKISTLGLVIVIFGYAGISTLKLALITGEGAEYVPFCDGTPETDMKACGPAAVCWEGLCQVDCIILGNECIDLKADLTNYTKEAGECPPDQQCVLKKTATSSSSPSTAAMDCSQQSNLGQQCDPNDALMHCKSDGTCGMGS